jgi:branched-chain amino acid transport system ATP-binding protein
VSLLKVQNLSISFGGLKAVQDFSIDVPRKALHGLIGPNGAGKTTCFNLLTGVYTPGRGTMELDGVSLLGRRPFEIARAGLSRTFQNIRLFPDLTALDNTRVAMHMRGDHTLAGTAARSRSFNQQESEQTDRGLALLRFFDLEGHASTYARNLCYGDQRRLEIARALAGQPRLLLLDEPAAGMNPAEKRELARSIRRIRDEMGLAILLIEHDMALVMDLCERITVLDHGQIIAVGTPAEVQSNRDVIAAYLGVEDATTGDLVANET